MHSMRSFNRRRATAARLTHARPAPTPEKLPICIRSMPACVAETPRQNRPRQRVNPMLRVNKATVMLHFDGHQSCVFLVQFLGAIPMPISSYSAVSTEFGWTKSTDVSDSVIVQLEQLLLKLTDRLHQPIRNRCCLRIACTCDCIGC